MAKSPLPPEPVNENMPVHSLRHRTLKAAIWKNQTDKGALYNVTITRSYRDGEGNWHDSQSFGYDDLTIVAKLLHDAHSYISALKAHEGKPAERPRKAARPPPHAPQ